MAGPLPGASEKGGETKNPSVRGAACRWLLGVSPIVPVTGLALAPWRLHQVAGRFIGPEPSTPL